MRKKISNSFDEGENYPVNNTNTGQKDLPMPQPITNQRKYPFDAPFLLSLSNLRQPNEKINMLKQSTMSKVHK